MRNVLLLFSLLIAKISYSNNLTYDYRGYTTNLDTMKLGNNSKFINFKNRGTWNDDKGNYGRGKCQGSVLIEEEGNTIEEVLYFCEFEDQEEMKFWIRGSRTGSLQEAGVGTNIFIAADEKYQKYINKKCVYAIKYIKDTFHAKNKCKLNKDN